MSDEGTHAPVQSARPSSALDRARMRLEASENDLAQNARDQILFRRVLVVLPAVGLCVAMLLWLVFHAGLWAVASLGSSVVVALLTSGTGLYMTAVRKREFEDAIRDRREEVAQFEATFAANPEDQHD
jgi:hypothetical protein